MITYAQGNLLTADVDALVNTVNTVGVMGKGIALQFKRAFPSNYDDYRAACERHEVRIGEMYVHRLSNVIKPTYIINFPTKRHWRSPSRLEDIESGLAALRDSIAALEISSIAIPPLGCGNGGLDWNVVRPRIEAALSDLSCVDVRVYAPGKPPAAEDMPVASAKPELTHHRAAFVALLGRYMRQGASRGLAVEPKISLLEAHKITYFLQKSGYDLRLAYEKGHFGPYSQSLDRAISSLEGHYLVGYGDGTGGREAALTLMPDASCEAEQVIDGDSEFEAAYSRLSQLVAGYEYPYGLELLSTTYFAAKELTAHPASLEGVVEIIGQWNMRKKRLFTAEHIADAWRRLEQFGFVAASEPRSVSR